MSSYLLVQYNQEKFHKGDPTFFISDQTQELHRVQSIRNQCLTLISSLIEVFGDQAVHAVLLVVHNLFNLKESGQKSDDNPWLAKYRSPDLLNFTDNGDDDEEESKVPLQEDMDPDEAKE